MNKKIYRKITSLYRDGMAVRTAVGLIIKLSQNNDDAAENIVRFFQNDARSYKQQEILNGDNKAAK